MKKLNDKGYIEDFIAGLIVLLIVGVFFLPLFTGFKLSNERVSGIVYNTTNDRFISGATKFSVRASEDTYVSEENRSSYCLPPGSKYIELVNKAAENKEIKVVVTAKKHFVVKAPWTCVNNVTVKEIK